MARTGRNTESNARPVEVISKSRMESINTFSYADAIGVAETGLLRLFRGQGRDDWLN